jgi:hypothetical protein
MFTESYSYVDGDTYVTWYPIMVNGIDGIFILHLQGKLRKLKRWYDYIKKFNKPLFFCDISNGAWDNHKQQVGEFSNGNIIYEFKGL